MSQPLGVHAHHAQISADSSWACWGLGTPQNSSHHPLWGFTSLCLPSFLPLPAWPCLPSHGTQR